MLGAGAVSVMIVLRAKGTPNFSLCPLAGESPHPSNCLLLFLVMGRAHGFSHFPSSPERPAKATASFLEPGRDDFSTEGFGGLVLWLQGL